WGSREKYKKWIEKHREEREHADDKADEDT
ncbi:hypothetical protein LCGC14_1636910, partial [marine sediment metagenome]